MEDFKVKRVVEEEIITVRKQKVMTVYEEPEELEVSEEGSFLGRVIGFLIGFGG